MSEPIRAAGSLLAGILVGIAAVWSFAALVGHSVNEVDRETLPYGRLYVSVEVVLLHALAVLPLASFSAIQLSRCLPGGRIAVVVGGIWLVAVVVLFRPGGFTGTFNWSGNTELFARAVLRTVVCLLVYVPSMWMVCGVATRWLKSRRAQDLLHSEQPEISQRAEHSLLLVSTAAFAVTLPCCVYPAIIQQSEATRDDELILGYIVDAHRTEEQLAAIVGDGRRSHTGSWYEDQISELKSQAVNPGQGVAGTVTRAQALIALARYEDAEPLFHLVWRRTGEPLALRGLSRIAYIRRAYKEAYDYLSQEVDVLQKRAEQRPDSDLSDWLANALLAQAQLALKREDSLDAMHLLQESLRHNETAEAHLTMVRTLHQLFRGRQAQAHMDRFVALEPTRQAEVRVYRKDLAEKALDCAGLSPVW